MRPGDVEKVETKEEGEDKRSSVEKVVIWELERRKPREFH